MWTLVNYEICSIFQLLTKKLLHLTFIIWHAHVKNSTNLLLIADIHKKNILYFWNYNRAIVFVSKLFFFSLIHHCTLKWHLKVIELIWIYTSVVFVNTLSTLARVIHRLIDSYTTPNNITNSLEVEIALS